MAANFEVAAHICLVNIMLPLIPSNIGIQEQLVPKWPVLAN